MKFGLRQIANVVFRAKSRMKIGNQVFNAGQPVFFLDTAKTSSMEGAATTVYATGGRGNSRLIAWEGERTLTFTVEDALLSPVSFAMLSGAGVVKGQGNEKVHFHQTSRAIVSNEVFASGDTVTITGSTNTEDKSGYIEWSTIDLSGAVPNTEKICPTAPVYIIKLDAYGDLTGEVDKGWKIFSASLSADGNTIRYNDDDTASTLVQKMEWLSGIDQTDLSNVLTALEPYNGKVLYKKHQDKHTDGTDTGMTPTAAGLETVMVDYYVIKPSRAVTELQIDMKRFGGYYYVEADTLFRRQSDGKDLPANLTFPNVKIQSNFTFSMAATGDPSTFTFTMDAFPGYTYFNKTNEVLCAIQIVDDSDEIEDDIRPLFPHPTGFTIKDVSTEDSVIGAADGDEDDEDSSSQG